MKEQLISFETAKLAKEKGFDIDCIHGFYYDGTPTNYSQQYQDILIPRPTQSLLQKWLREKRNIFVTVYEDFYNTAGWYFGVFYGTYPTHQRITNTESNIVPSLIYEESLEIGLSEALKLI